MPLRCFVLLLALCVDIAHAATPAPAVLAEINFARTQPQEYAQIVAAAAGNYPSAEGQRDVREAVAFLERAKPLPPLAWSAGISKAALSHAEDIGTRGARGHRGSGGSTPWRRMARFGQYSGYAGENIDYGRASPRSIVVALIVDHGVRSRAHRDNLFSRQYRVAGAAIAPHAVWGTTCVMDFATAFSEPGERRLTDRLATPLRREYMGNSFY